MSKKIPSEKIPSRRDLLDKLREEYKESETLQWFIEVEIKRLISNDNSYQELKKIAEISAERIAELNSKSKGK
ncbi:hypothetical protein ACFSTE_05915 [Aquimarina hainanensis]|uniref:Uncharacterized protein n=1 Tax=Aquimarina hainanensis TaxID=1578017 RepID=A0ABW5N3Z5_9FLAO